MIHCDDYSSSVDLCAAIWCNMLRIVSHATDCFIDLAWGKPFQSIQLFICFAIKCRCCVQWLAASLQCVHDKLVEIYNIIFHQEIQTIVEQRERELRSAQSSASHNVLSTSAKTAGNVVGAQLNGHENFANGFFNSAVTNLIVIVGFAAFAFAVKHVLSSMVDE